MPAIDQAEEALSNALVAVVNGARIAVAPAQIIKNLARHFSIGVGEVQVKRYSRADVGAHKTLISCANMSSKCMK
jgi:hypothetical protein